MIKTYRLRNLLLGGQLTGDSLEALLEDREYLGAMYELRSNGRMLQDAAASPLALEALVGSGRAMDALATGGDWAGAFLSTDLAKGYALGSDTVMSRDALRKEVLDEWSRAPFTDPAAGTSAALPSFMGLCFSPEDARFVGVGNKVAGWSADGGNWATRTLSVQYWDVCRSPEKNLFVAAGTTRTATSSDGASWRENTTTLDMRGVCWSSAPGLFVGAATGGLATSDDGVNWVTRHTGSWNHVCASPSGRLVAAGNNTFAAGANGTSWSNVTVTGVDWQRVCWDDHAGRFAALGYSSGGVGRFAWSTTGSSWTVADAPTPTGCGEFSLIFAPRLRSLVAVGRTVHISDNGGSSWRALALPAAALQTRAAWDPVRQRLLVHDRNNGTAGRFSLSGNWGL